MLSCFLRPLSFQLILCSKNCISPSKFAGNQITVKQLLHNKSGTSEPLEVWGTSTVACFALLVIQPCPLQTPRVVWAFRLLNNSFKKNYTEDLVTELRIAKCLHRLLVWLQSVANFRLYFRIVLLRAAFFIFFAVNWCDGDHTEKIRREKRRKMMCNTAVRWISNQVQYVSYAY